MWISLSLFLAVRKKQEADYSTFNGDPEKLGRFVCNREIIWKRPLGFIHQFCSLHVSRCIQFFFSFFSDNEEEESLRLQWVISNGTFCFSFHFFPLHSKWETGDSRKKKQKTGRWGGKWPLVYSQQLLLVVVKGKRYSLAGGWIQATCPSALVGGRHDSHITATAPKTLLDFVCYFLKILQLCFSVTYRQSVIKVKTKHVPQKMARNQWFQRPN